MLVVKLQSGLQLFEVSERPFSKREEYRKATAHIIEESASLRQCYISLKICEISSRESRKPRNDLSTNILSSQQTTEPKTKSLSDEKRAEPEQRKHSIFQISKLGGN